MIDAKRKTLPVIEIFGPTLQGEGEMIGKITHFIRLGGCDYRCTWCDSLHSVTPEQVRKNARWLLPEDIIAELKGVANWVTLTGGNPALHDLEVLVDELLNHGFQIAVETQGSIYRAWMTRCKVVTLSPKGPSSGMQDLLAHEVLNKYLDKCNVNMKIVIFNDEDLLFASRLHEVYGKAINNWYLSIGTRPTDTTNDIIERWKSIAEGVMKRWPSLREFAILPQAHVLLWGHALGK